MTTPTTRAMTPQTDIDAIRERHAEAMSQTTGKGKGHCCLCGVFDQRWPCDTRIVLDALDATEAILTIARNDLIREGMERDAARDLADELSRRLDAEITRADAARADADWLAEALREHIDRWYTIEPSGYAFATYTGSPDISPLRAALAAHEERVR